MAEQVINFNKPQGVKKDDKMEFLRKRNMQEATGEPYDFAFTQTEIQERGWTVSMIRRHIGQPNAVTCCPTTYRYDRRRVYAAEATPSVQFDLLATADVRLIGPRWLTHYAAYVPNIMRASLTTAAANAENEAEAGQILALAANLPAAKVRKGTQIGLADAGIGILEPVAPVKPHCPTTAPSMA